MSSGNIFNPAGALASPGGSSSDDDDDDIYAALTDESLPQHYIKQNRDQELREELGLWDYFKATGRGLDNGVTQGLESGLHILHLLGRKIGAEDIQDWSRDYLNEIAEKRRNDPGYTMDPAWEQSKVASTLYSVGNAVAATGTIALPGVGFSVLSGGATLPAAVMAGMVGSDVLGGVSTYERLLLESHAQTSAANPNVTLEDIEDQHFFDAALAAGFEAGAGAASTFLGGKVIGLVGKGAGVMGRGVLDPAKATAKELLEAKIKKDAAQATSYIGRAFKGAVSGAFSEVPGELATEAFEDYTRKKMGLPNQGAVAAMKEALIPAIAVGGIFGGLGGALAKRRDGSVDIPDNVLPQDARDQLNEAGRSLKEAQLQDEFGESGFRFMKEGLSKLGMDEKQTLGLMYKLKSDTMRKSQETGRDGNLVWQELSDGFAERGAEALGEALPMVQAMMTPGNDLQSILGSTIDSLIGGLDDSGKASINAVYGSVDGDGAVSLDQSRLVQDAVAWVQNPEAVELAPAVAQSFETVRNRLLDSFANLEGRGFANIDEGTRKLFRNTLQQNGQPIAKLPAIVEIPDQAALEADLAALPRDSSSSGKAALAIAKHARINLNPLLVDPEPANIIKAIDQAASDIFDKYVPKQTDKATEARIAKEFEQSGYSINNINSLYNDVVGHEEGSLSYRLRKAQFMETAVVNHLNEMAAETRRNPSTQNLAQMFYARDLFMSVHGMLRGVQGEAGRTMRAIRFRGKDGMYDMRQLEALVEELGGAQTGLAIADVFAKADPGNPESLKAAAELATKGKFMQGIAEAKTLGHLMGPSTHLVNFLGNAMNLPLEITNRALAGLHNGDPSKGGVYKGEALAMVAGIWDGLKTFREIWSSHKADNGGSRWKAYNNIKDLGKRTEVDDGGTMPRALNRQLGQDIAETFIPGKDNKYLSSMHGRATQGLSVMTDLFGKGLELGSSNALYASDLFFKHLAYNMELAALRYRSARAEAEGGKVSLAEALKREPTNTDKKAAMETAKFLTFQSDLTGLNKTLNQARAKHPWLRLFVPFLKTPVNILKYVGASTPGINKLMADVREQLESPDPARRQIAEARVMLGTVMYTTALGLAAGGFLTGSGPSDPEERKKWLAAGHQSNSLKLGDTYIGFDRLDPIAFFLSTAANLVEMMDTLDDDDVFAASAVTIGAALNVVKNRSYLQSVTQLVDIIGRFEEPEGQRALKDFLAGFVPASSLTRGAARVIDPVARDTSTFWNRLRADIPGWSQEVPERRDFLGRVMENPSYAGGPGLLSPFRMSKETDDPVYKEIDRLSRAGISVGGNLQRTIRKGNAKAKLSATKYAEYLALFGEKIMVDGKNQPDALNALVTSRFYSTLNDEQKGALIEAARAKYRKAATTEMINSDKDVRFQMGM